MKNEELIDIGMNEKIKKYFFLPLFFFLVIFSLLYAFRDDLSRITDIFEKSLQKKEKDLIYQENQDFSKVEKEDTFGIRIDEDGQNSYIKEIDLDVDDISFSVSKDIFILDSSEKKSYYLREDEENIWTDISLPGHLYFNFTPYKKELFDNNKNGELYVFPLEGNNFENEDFSYFLDNYLEITSLMQELEIGKEYNISFPGIIAEIDKNGKWEPKFIGDQFYYVNIPFNTVVNFPPTSMGAFAVYDIEKIVTSTFSGVRMLVPGFFPDFAPAKQPTYVFQGVTNDNKYLIVIRFDLYSEKLEELLKQENLLYDIESFQEWVEFVNKTFEVVEESSEEDFYPSIEKMDDFVRTVEIKK